MPTYRQGMAESMAAAEKAALETKPDAAMLRFMQDEINRKKKKKDPSRTLLTPRGSEAESPRRSLPTDEP